VIAIGRKRVVGDNNYLILRVLRITNPDNTSAGIYKSQRQASSFVHLNKLYIRRDGEESVKYTKRGICQLRLHSK